MECIEEIRKSRTLPIIAVIGATIPTKPYASQTGHMVGYQLRNYLENHPGSLVTGGVEGIGVDIYTGIIKFCIDASMKQGNLPEDKFFIVIPHYIIEQDILKRTYKEPYNPPQAYEALAALSRKGELDIVRLGNDMSERRAALAYLADKMIVVNGGYGTIDEATLALSHGKEIIALSGTGGAAAFLCQIVNDKVSMAERRALAKNGISVENIISRKELVKPVGDITEMVELLSQQQSFI